MNYMTYMRQQSSVSDMRLIDMAIDNPSLRIRVDALAALWLKIVKGHTGSSRVHFVKHISAWVVDYNDGEYRSVKIDGDTLEDTESWLRGELSK